MTQMTSSPAAAAASKPRTYGASRQLPDATLIEWLRQMLLIREFEVRCAQAYQQAKIGGFCHLYIGQEACAVGTIGSVNPDDPVITAYRDHGHALARGMSARACMAEMYGKAAGCAKGKGGSMHMFDRPHWLFGGHGIVGAQTPLGAGLAFAARYEWEVLKRSVNRPDGSPASADEQIPAKKKVALCYLGDGALNQGALHEAMNLAGLWSLPVIYIVENNRYSMGTSIERGTTMAHNLLAKPAAYGIEGLKIEEHEAMDILALYDKFKPFVDELRAKQRPGFVDLHTYRYQGHSMSDPQKYRTKEEVEGVKSRDSIDHLAKHLLSNDGGGRGCLSEAQFIDMQKQIKAEVADALEFSEAAPVPDVGELYSDVYMTPEPNLSPTRDYVQGAKNPLL
jgi:pyruvate dehydrogenase E1 component alpha subunit